MRGKYGTCIMLGQLSNRVIYECCIVLVSC